MLHAILKAEDLGREKQSFRNSVLHGHIQMRLRAKVEDSLCHVNTDAIGAKSEWCSERHVGRRGGGKVLVHVLSEFLKIIFNERGNKIISRE